MRAVVDTHVHLLPERLGASIRGFFAAHGVEQGRWAYGLDNAATAARLAEEGVAQAWTLPYVRTPGRAEGLNAAISSLAADLSATGPLEVVPGATVHPGDADPAGIVRRAVEAGARVCKLHCSVGGHDADDARLDPVWDYASAVRLPVVVHAGHAVGGHTEGAELDPVEAVARRWPEARLVIAHCGHRAAGRAIELLAAHPALHADLTPVVSEPVELPEGAVGVADRLLFGSDAPNSAFTVTESLAALPGHLGPAVRGDNARRLLAEVRP